MLEKIGRSGVELHEIRSSVSLEGKAPTGEKPKNNYSEFKRQSRQKGSGFSGNRSMSCGFGPSKLNHDDSMPKLTPKQRRMLLDIDDGKMGNLSALNPIAAQLWGKGLITWINDRGCYVAMAEGRRIAEMLRDDHKR